MKRANLHSFFHSMLFTLAFVSFCSGQSYTKVVENNTPEFSGPEETGIPFVQADSMVRSIFEDSKGNLWCGRDHAGLTRYDGESITHFNIADGLSDNQIRTIQEDQEGNIWFATGNGISKYDGEKFTVHSSSDSLTSNLKLDNHWQRGTDDLWFNGELEGGIYRYDGQNLSILNFPILASNHESFSISGTVTGICEGKNNMLWMSNYSGVIGFDGESFSFINDRTFRYHVRSIFEDSKGNLWIGNNGIGVLLYDGDSTIRFTEINGENVEWMEEGAPNHVFAIAEDGDGDIWFGDRDTGAWKYDGEVLSNYSLNDGLTSTFVRAIYKDKKGRMLFGLGDGSVCKFNGKTFDKVF